MILIKFGEQVGQSFGVRLPDMGTNATEVFAKIAEQETKGSDSVSLINVGTNKVSTTIGVGSAPLVVAVNPQTHVAYVANNSSGTLSVLTRHCPI